MTDAPAHFMLPVDESAPPERLRWSMLLIVGAAVLLVHLALFTVFTPLAPEPVGDASARTEHALSFLSSRAAESDPRFLQMAERYDPISFLHPPESVGFSFFRTAQAETGFDAPLELPLPERFSPVAPQREIALAAVSRPLLPDVSDPDPDKIAAAAPAYPYWAADSVSGIAFPAFQLDTASGRIFQRQQPSKPSVFLVKPPVLPDLPYEAILEESCGVADLDLAARAWLDTLLNSSDCPAGLKGDGGSCRVVWSAAALRKGAVR